MKPNKVIKVLGRPALWATAPGRKLVEGDKAIWAWRCLHTQHDCFFLRRVQPATGRQSEVVRVRLEDVDARWDYFGMSIVFARGGIAVAHYCNSCLLRDIRDGYMPSDTLMKGGRFDNL